MELKHIAIWCRQIGMKLFAGIIGRNRAGLRAFSKRSGRTRRFAQIKPVLSLRGRLGDRSNPSESAEIKSHRRQSKDDPEIHACLGSTSGRPPVEIRLFTSDKLTMACKQKSSCESQSVSQSFNSRIFTGGNPRTIRDQSSAAPVNQHEFIRRSWIKRSLRGEGNEPIRCRAFGASASQIIPVENPV